MTTYTIGQVAERTGFRSSALRYYEDHGLVEPVGRTEAGYRLYDDGSIARLRFIARAKQLGCSLEEIADLAELWAADDCGPVQRRLHELVTDKIVDAERRSDELRRFTTDLQTAAAHLGGEPLDGACDETCACLTSEVDRSSSVQIVLGERAEPAIACTLQPDEVAGRVDDWRRATNGVVGRETLPGGATGVRLVFDAGAPIDEVARLAVAEQGCCSFFSFTLTIDGRGTALEVRAPAEAEELVTSIFGAAPRGAPVA